jgi:hypothetical protein
MKNRTQRLLLLFAGLGLAAATAVSAQQGATLGTGGQVFFARTGTYGELFKGGDPHQAKNPVLALEIVRPDAPTLRLLVPTTEGEAAELAPSLLFEESSNTLFLLWESRVNRLNPVLKLVGFDGLRWIDPVEIGNPAATKSSPQLAITRDRYTVGAGEDAVVRSRTVVHLLWREEAAGALAQTLYTPIILENGTFTGVSPEQIYDLTELDPSSASVTLPELPGNVASVLRLQAGRDSQTVVAAFTSPGTRRVVSVEIDVLPAELSLVADDARSHIVDIGRRSSYPANLKLVADDARSHIVDIGRRFFHSEIAMSLADQIRARIVASQGKDDLETLADIARSHIIDIGAKLSGRGLLQATGLSVSRIVEVTGSLTEHPLQHLFQFRLASSRPAPEVGSGDVSLFVSKTGKDILVAWTEAQRVLYRESQGDEWRGLQEIKLSPNVSLQRAYEILEQRTSRR